MAMRKWSIIQGLEDFPSLVCQPVRVIRFGDKLTEEEKIINIMAEALAAIVRDGADSRSVVEAISSVSEVRDVLAEDILR